METSYVAAAFHPQLPEGSTAGRIHITTSTVTFVSSSGKALVELPLLGMRAVRGGATGDHIFFTHPEFPEWTLTTRAPGIVKDPHLLAIPGLAPQVRRAHFAQRLVLLGCGFLILLFGAGLVAAVVFREVLVAGVANQIPPNWEAQMGDVAFQQVKATSPLMTDPQLVQELERLAAPLVRAVPDKRWNYRLHLVRAAEPNAFALPGGNIAVHSGLILTAERPEEVLGVLAHEIAHVSERHGTRQLINQAGLLLLLQAAVGDVTGLLGYLVHSGEYLLTQKYSRGHEREADEKGREYLLAAGIDPSGLADFFLRLHKLEQERGLNHIPEILSTHPATEERIKWLQTMDREAGKKPTTKMPIEEFRRFQERVKVAAASR